MGTKRGSVSDRESRFVRAGFLAKSFTQACLFMFDSAGGEDPVRRTALAALLPFSLAWVIDKTRRNGDKPPIGLHFQEGSAQLKLACRWVAKDPALQFLRSVSVRCRSRGGYATFTFTGASLRRYAPPPGLIGKPLARR
jgi:hypothetical protein